MMRWIGVAAVACAFALTAPASATAATSAKPQAGTQQRHAGKATDFSAQRHHHHYHRHHYRHGYGPYYRSFSTYQPYGSYYYARPYYYRPYPYAAPAPFTFGFGFGPFW
ncbi:MULTISPECIES: hypothetical protein [unclassified Bradyrhizobium]|uniref:hypothetical protein n=1 Tax=unclassified Bradyrhizobium TaxID=2631580 RepID=UPI000A03347B|nr:MULTISPECIES: hypothetical protein [unclassified Bradyrhizobium]QIG91039.1 hypothetical protein G6P99_30980 [Bradyrhizobium sp. 6(2017)]